MLVAQIMPMWAAGLNNPEAYAHDRPETADMMRRVDIPGLGGLLFVVEYQHVYVGDDIERMVVEHGAVDFSGGNEPSFVTNTNNLYRAAATQWGVDSEQASQLANAMRPDGSAVTKNHTWYIAEQGVVLTNGYPKSAQRA